MTKEDLDKKIADLTGDETFFKALKTGEPKFVLRAQDLTADILTECWADVNRLLAQYLRRGYTIPQALHQIKAHLLPLKQQLEPQVTNKKVEEAYAIAKRMAQHTNRKVAD